MAEAADMYPEELWDACEQLDRNIDAQEYARQHLVRKPR